jgi:hypothetical protein
MMMTRKPRARVAPAVAPKEEVAPVVVQIDHTTGETATVEAPKVETPVAVQPKGARRAKQKWATKEQIASWKAEDRIVLLVKENPKRTLPRDRFALYFAEGGLTVGQYLEQVEAMGKAGVKGATKTVAKADLSWDVGHGFIEIQPAKQEG